MNLEEAKQLVFEKKPVLAQIYNTYRDTTWLQYAKKIYSNPPQFSTYASELFIVIHKLLHPLIGESKTTSTIATLKRTGFVSTTDHHGILCHPFFADSALVRSHPQFIRTIPSVIACTCGGISLNNSSYPRGIFFHDTQLHEIRMALISLRERRRSVYGLPAISVKTIQRERNRIKTFSFANKQKDKLYELLDLLQKTNHIWQQKYFSDQLTVINDVMWDMVFGGQRGNLVYLEAESILRRLLLDIHLKKHTLIYALLFESSVRQSYLKHFNSVTGAHTQVPQRGSEIFWYIDKKEHVRKGLYIQRDQLISVDKKTSIRLDPELISKHLEHYTLLPTLAFTYSVLAFYYGLTLGGGFSQVQYLGSMKKAWHTVCKEAGYDKQCDPKTDIFTGEFVAVGLGKNKKTIPASLIDMFLWSETDRSSIIDRQLANISVGESLDCMMPEFVKIITGTGTIITHSTHPPDTFHVD